MNNLVVLFFACALALVSADDLDNRRNAAADACKKELKVGDDVASILKTKDVPKNEAQNCFLECVYGKLGLVKDGKLNNDGAKALAKAKFGEDKAKLDKADGVFKKCQDEVLKNKSAEKCALGKSLRSCLLVNGGDLQIFKP